MYHKRGGYREVPSIFEEFCKAVSRAYNDGIDPGEDPDGEDYEDEESVTVVEDEDDGDGDKTSEDDESQ